MGLHIVENVCDLRLRHLRRSLENIFSFFVKLNLSSGPINVEGRESQR